MDLAQDPAKQDDPLATAALRAFVSSGFASSDPPGSAKLQVVDLSQAPYPPEGAKLEDAEKDSLQDWPSEEVVSVYVK